MSPQPYAELLFDPFDLSQKARREVAEATRDTSVRGALERALFAQQIFMVTEARRRVADAKEITPELLMRVLDYSWQVFTPRYVKISGPQIALAYSRAFSAAQAGNVDAGYIETLAAEHARRLSTYFHQSSATAVVEGFNAYVNRKVPVRAAADKALSAYGLTSRQMSGYLANTAMDSKVTSTVFRRAEARAYDYIAKSLRQRVGKFAAQEEHNLDQQAEQIAWMWMVEHDQLPENAEKIWLTARDERTCALCAPMHGKVVKINERFELPNKVLLWVPGVHPNCRCKARFRVPRRLEIAKADQPYYGDDPDERDRRGRFAAKNRPGPVFKEPDVEEDQARERVQGLLERVTPTISMAESEIEKPISMRGTAARVSMPRAISMSDPQVSMTPQQQGKISLAPTTGTRISLRDRFAEISMRKGIEGVVSLAGERAERAAIQPKMLYMNVINLTGPDGPGPIYRVINPYVETLDETGRVHYEHSQQWTNDPAEVSAQAIEWRKDTIKETAMHLKEEPSRPYHDESEESHILLTDSQIDDLVQWVADQNIPSEKARAPRSEEVQVYTPDIDGDGLEHWDDIAVTYKELADLFDLKPQMFNMDVAVVTRGHDSELGRTDVRPGEQEDIVTLSGDYEVTETHRGETILGSEKAPGITFYHLDPADIEVEVIHGNE